jgi:hypothetical protein
MALLFIDGFDHYATADITRKWTDCNFSTDLDIVTGGRNGGNRLRLCAANQYTAPYVFKTALPASGSTVILGSAVNFNTQRADEVWLYKIYLGSTILFTLAWEATTGRIKVFRGNEAYLFGTTTFACSPNTWYYIEFKAVIHSSTGTYELRINGDNVLSGSGNTQVAATATWDGISLWWDGGASQSTKCYFDDLYVCDGSGSVLNDFLGDCRVDTHFATADGTTHTFTPLSGTHTENVDDTAPDGDTTYNGSTAADDKDTFVTEDFKNTATAEIKAVQINMMAAKSSPGSSRVCSVVRHSGTDNDGTSLAVGAESYVDYMQVLEQNPNGGSPTDWTPTDFNAAEFGYKRVE